MFALSLASAISLVQAQSSVPSDLTSGFDPDAITLQVAYDSQEGIGHGFADGTKFQEQRKPYPVHESDTD